MEKFVYRPINKVKLTPQEESFFQTQKKPLMILVIVTITCLLTTCFTTPSVSGEHPKIQGVNDLKSFVEKYCDEETQNIWEHVAWYAEYNGIKREVPFAIAWADSSCGTNMTTANNPGNVGNNDRGNRVGFNNMFDGWKAIIDTLNNQYIGQIDLIGHLSQGGRNNMTVERSCHNPIRGYSCYATSEENWNANVINALQKMNNNKKINETFKIRY